jgi:hypothetical protein
MPPIKLSDAELTAVLAAAGPLAVDRRDSFLQQVAASLGACTDIGPGTVHRAIAEAQRQFFDPPNLEHVGTGKYGRGG